jgi:hypothetical protein
MLAFEYFIDHLVIVFIDQPLPLMIQNIQTAPVAAILKVLN